MPQHRCKGAIFLAKVLQRSASPTYARAADARHLSFSFRRTCAMLKLKVLRIHITRSKQVYARISRNSPAGSRTVAPFPCRSRLLLPDSSEVGTALNSHHHSLVPECAHLQIVARWNSCFSKNAWPAPLPVHLRRRSLSHPAVPRNWRDLRCSFLLCRGPAPSSCC